MSTPVFEQQRLSNVSEATRRKPSKRDAALPLGLPSEAAHTQALELVTNGDILIGCADSGVDPSLSDEVLLGACTLLWVGSPGENADTASSWYSSVRCRGVRLPPHAGWHVIM